MGHMQATAYADLVDEGYSLDTVLSAHLMSNHFPPINPAFVPNAKEAIEAADAGDWDREITLANGMTKTVASIVEELHLDAFLDGEEEE